MNMEGRSNFYFQAATKGIDEKKSEVKHLQVFSTTGELVLTERKMELSKLSPSQKHGFERQKVVKPSKDLQESYSFLIQQISRAERPRLPRRAGSPLHRDRMPVHAKEKLTAIMNTWKEVQVKNPIAPRGDIRLRSMKEVPITADADLMKVQSYQKDEDDEWYAHAQYTAGTSNSKHDKANGSGMKPLIDDESTALVPVPTTGAIIAAKLRASAANDIKVAQLAAGAAPISPRDKLTAIRRSIAPLNPGFAPLVSTTSYPTSSVRAMGSGSALSQFEVGLGSTHMPRRISEVIGANELTNTHGDGDVNLNSFENNKAVKAVTINSRVQSTRNSPMGSRPTSAKIVNDGGNLHLYQMKHPLPNSAQSVGKDSRSAEPMYSPSTYRRPHKEVDVLFENGQESSGNILQVYAAEDDYVGEGDTNQLLLSPAMHFNQTAPLSPMQTLSSTDATGRDDDKDHKKISGGTIYRTLPLTDAALLARRGGKAGGAVISKYVINKKLFSPGKFEQRRPGRDFADDARERGDEAKARFDPLRFGAGGHPDSLLVESVPVSRESNDLSRKFSTLSKLGDDMAADLAREWSYSAPAPEQLKGLDSPPRNFTTTRGIDSKISCCECTAATASLWCEKCRLPFCFHCWGKIGHHNQTDAIHAMRAMKSMYKTPTSPWGFASDIFDDYGERPERLPIPDNCAVKDNTVVQPRVEPACTKYDDYPLGEYYMDAEGKLKPLSGGSGALSPLKSTFAPATGSALKLRLRESLSTAPRIRSLTAKKGGGGARSRSTAAAAARYEGGGEGCWFFDAAVADGGDVESLPSTVKGVRKQQQQQSDQGGGRGGQRHQTDNTGNESNGHNININISQRATSPSSVMTDASAADEVAALRRAMNMGSTLVGDGVKVEGGINMGPQPLAAATAAANNHPVGPGDMLLGGEGGRGGSQVLVMAAHEDQSQMVDSIDTGSGIILPAVIMNRTAATSAVDDVMSSSVSAVHPESSGEQIVDNYIASVMHMSQEFKTQDEERKVTAAAKLNIDTDFKARMHVQALKRMHAYEFTGPRVQQQRPHSPPSALNLGVSPVSIGGVAGSRKPPKSALPLHMHTSQFPSPSTSSSSPNYKGGFKHGGREIAAPPTTPGGVGERVKVSDMYLNIEKMLGLDINNHDTVNRASNGISDSPIIGGREAAVFNGKVVYIRNVK